MDTLYLANKSKKSTLDIPNTLAAVPDETRPNSNNLIKELVLISILKSFVSNL